MSDFQMARGETRNFVFTVLDRVTGLPVDITGAKVYATVRGMEDEIVFAKKNDAAGGDDDEIEILEQVANRGKYKLKITHDDSDIAPAPRWLDSWVRRTDSEHIQVEEHAPFHITATETRDF